MNTLPIFAAVALSRVFEDDGAFTRLVDAVQEIVLDRDNAETEAEAIVAALASRAATPDGSAAPRVFVRTVTPHGVRIGGRHYSGSFLLGHVGHPVAIELMIDADHPGRRIAVVRTVEAGLLLGTAYVAEETLADVIPVEGSPMLRRVRFELDAAAAA